MLCLAGKNLTQLNKQITGENADNLKHLDVSINQLSRGIEFRPFINLMTLIIDENQFSTLAEFPVFRDLQTFSANKNNFSNLAEFITQASEKFGKLKNISLLKNPFNPISEGQQKYATYKKIFLAKFSSLKTLDGSSTDGKQNELLGGGIEQHKYEKIIATISFDQKYAQDAVKSVKTRSEGNRFLKNNHL